MRGVLIKHEANGYIAVGHLAPYNILQPPRYYIHISRMYVISYAAIFVKAATLSITARSIEAAILVPLLTRSSDWT